MVLLREALLNTPIGLLRHAILILVTALLALPAPLRAAAGDGFPSAPHACTHPVARTPEMPVVSLVPPDPSKGRFLVATRQIRDPRFMETVILLLKYDREGAIGLIINKPTEMKVSAVLPNIEGLAQRADLLHIGGPVGMQQLFVLVRGQKQPEESNHVFEDVYVTTSSDTLQTLARNRHGEKFKVYAGYAGWAPGQLDQEIAKGGWHVAGADASAVFDRAPADLWPDFISRSETIEVRIHGAPVSALTSSPGEGRPPAGHRRLHFAHVTY